jgi:hypothetical protein
VLCQLGDDQIVLVVAGRRYHGIHAADAGITQHLRVASIPKNNRRIL